MNAASQFLLNNLLPAIVAGCLAWAFVHLAVYLFGIRHGKLRLCLYLAPLLKSTLVLLGLGTVLPWPRDIFATWASQATPAQTVLPIFLVLTGLVLLTRNRLAARARRQLVAGARPADEEGRLASALDRVMSAYRDNEHRIQARCQIEPLPHRPELLVHEGTLHTPAVVTAGGPVVVFPSRLLERLDAAELEAALAHEVAHVYLRQPTNCFTSETVRMLATLNPFAGVMASQLQREEEKACDDIAVDIVGDPEGYAAMLLRSYRYAAATAGPLAGGLQYVHQLLGVRPVLSERVEHLMARDETYRPARQRLGFAVTWILLIVVFFSS